MKIASKVSLAAVNISVVVLALYAAFAATTGGLHELAAISIMSAAVGVFGAYGSIVAMLLVFVGAGKLQRLLACALALGFGFYLLFVCFNELKQFNVIAHHFFGIVLGQLVILGTVRHATGWEIKHKGDEPNPRRRGQFQLWLLFAWASVVALLSNLLRSETFSRESLVGTGLLTIFFSALCFGTMMLILRNTGALTALSVVAFFFTAAVSVEAYSSKFLIGVIPNTHLYTIVFSTNAGALAAMLFSLFTIRLGDYRLSSK